MRRPAGLPSAPPDLENRSDVAELVRCFYARAFADELLGPVFEAAQMDLEAHLPVMCDFWETVLFRTGTYRRNALIVHRDLHERVPLREELFHRWLALWVANVDASFAGPKAEVAKLQASRIAGAMGRRLLSPSRP